jgi:CRISPR-associated protein Cas2
VVDVLVAYDINTTTAEGARRLVRMAKVCEGYGTRVQYSVFECRLSPTKLTKLTSELTSTIVRPRDSVHIYRFDGLISAARTSLGRQLPRELSNPGYCRGSEASPEPPVIFVR